MKRDLDLQELASAVAEGREVEWDAMSGEDPTVVENLKRISSLMAAHQHLVREHLPFETWGKLRLLEKIGEGGFGEVYRAWDESLGREVALKLFRQKQDGDSVRGTMSSRQAEDLMLEARRLARVRHENVVHVYGAEEHRHRAGFWMELVTGETLASVMHAEGTMGPEEAAHIGLKLSGGLAAIHRAGLLHRDVKAQNVMREPDGRIVLTDMGAGVDLRFTASGLPRSIAGTPLYMAPEAIAGRGGDHTADIYSLGVLLYHLVTGRFPYESQTSAGLMEDHRSGRRVRLAERRADLPADFVEVVERACAHDPRNRFQSATDLAEALRPFARDPAWAAPARSRVRPAFVVILAAVLLGAGALAGMRLFAPEPVRTEDVPRGQVRRLTFSGKATVPLWSPDGSTIAYTEMGEIFLISPSGENLRKVELPEGTEGVAWTWSGNSHELLGHGGDDSMTFPEIFSIDVLTGQFRVLVEQGVFPALSPDGKTLAYATPYGGDRGTSTIALKDLATGETRTLVESPEPGTAVYKPQFTPDGQELLYIRWAGLGHEIWRIGLDGSDRRQVPTGLLQPSGQYCFTEDGRHILIGAELYGLDNIWRIDLEGPDRVPLTAGGPTQHHVNLGPDGQSFCFSTVTHSGRLAYFDRTSGELTYPTTLDFDIRQPMIAADGRSLFFQAQVNGVWQIWHTGLDGNLPARVAISGDSVSCFSPVPAPGGILHLRGVVPKSNIFGTVKWKQSLWFTSEDGGRQQPWPVAGDQISRLAPSGARDGRVLYTEMDAQGETFFVTDRDGPRRELTRYRAGVWILQFDWGRGPDDVVLLRFQSESGQRSVSIQSLDLGSGKESTLLTSADLPFGGENEMYRCRALVTSPDGSRLALLFHDGVEGVTRLAEYEFKTGEVRLLEEIAGEFVGQHVAWAPDGSGLAVTFSKQSEDIYIWEPQRAPEVAAAR